MAKYRKNIQYTGNILQYTGNGIGPELPNQYNTLKTLYNIFQNKDVFERFSGYVHYNSTDDRFYFTISDYDYHRCNIPEDGECWISNCLLIPPAKLTIKNNAIILNSTIDSDYYKPEIIVINNSFLYDVHIVNNGKNCTIIITDNATLINSKIVISENVKDTTLIISGYSSIFNTYININNTEPDKGVVPSQIQLYNCFIGNNTINTKMLLNRTITGCDIGMTQLPHLDIRNKPEYEYKPYIFSDTIVGTNYPDIVCNKATNCIGNGYEINEQINL